MNALRFGFASVLLAGFAATASAQFTNGTPAPRASISRDINTYVLFAYDELTFKGGNAATNSGYIVGGNIGVNYPGTSPSGYSLNFATSGRAIMSDGYQAVADSVRGDAAGSFFDLFANSENPSFASTIRGSGPMSFSTPIVATPSLPTLPFTPGRALTDNGSDLTVLGSGGQPSPYTLSPGVAYRDIRLNDHAVLNLGAGTFNIRNLSIGKDVTINLSDSSILQIDRRLDPNDDLKLGLNSGYNGLAQLLIGGFGDNPNTERTTNFSHGAVVHAQYFAPNSWLDLGGGNNLYGRYWAKRITGDPNNNVYFVPEPATMALLMLGGLALRRRSTQLCR